MAKKRKNDTRLDPFATAVGSSSLDALLEQANAGDVIRMPAPSDPNREITLVCKVIAHNEIEKSTQVYGKTFDHGWCIGDSRWSKPASD